MALQGFSPGGNCNLLCTNQTNHRAVSHMFNGPKWVAAPYRVFIWSATWPQKPLKGFQEPIKISRSFEEPLKAFQEPFENLEKALNVGPILCQFLFQTFFFFRSCSRVQARWQSDQRDFVARVVSTETAARARCPALLAQWLAMLGCASRSQASFVTASPC